MKLRVKKHQYCFSVRRKLVATSIGVIILLSVSACDSGNQTSSGAVKVKVAEGTLPVSEKKIVGEQLLWSDDEKSLLKTLSINNLPDFPVDPSNKYLSNSAAIKLGKKLFFDPRLSQTGTVSCGTCHQPERHFSDGMRVASGVQPGKRNTPSLLGVSHQQWLFWDGRKDSVWAQALDPFENPNEHNLTRVSVVKKVLDDQEYLRLYKSVFGDTLPVKEYQSWPQEANPNGDISRLKLWKSLPIESRKTINRIFVNIGKSIAAYEATLKFPESRFDRFLDNLGKVEGASSMESNGKDIMEDTLSNNEQLGLKLFIGKASCISCHHSALLSNQHFQNIGTGVRGKDMGRSQVAESQAWDVFNCLGEYSDASESDCKNLKFMSKDRHGLSGSFKVPSLRNVSKTAPYMHDGRFKTLNDVVRFYVNPPSQKRTGHHLPEINLDEKEQKQLTDFLRSL